MMNKSWIFYFTDHHKIVDIDSSKVGVLILQVRGLRYGDFQKAMTVIRPSLQKSKWEELERWNQEFGAN